MRTRKRENKNPKITPERETNLANQEGREKACMLGQGSGLDKQHCGKMKERNCQMEIAFAKANSYCCR